MAMTVIGRPVNGISINPELEFLLDEDGVVRYFEGIGKAQEFLKKQGYSTEEMSFFTFMESCGVCRRCGAPLFRSLLPEYAYQCFSCDEDFYAFEQGDPEDQQKASSFDEGSSVTENEGVAL